MRLWTWQKKGFSLTRGKVEGLKHSDYLNGPCMPECEKARFREAYKKLRERLGTDQFLWFFTNEEEAKNNPSKLGYEGKVLWEIDVPENEVSKLVWICPKAWRWIIYREDGWPSKKFDHLYAVLNDFYLSRMEKSYSRDQFCKEYSNYWQELSDDKLWEAVFYNCGIRECQNTLVYHPVEKGWIKGSWAWKDVYS